MDAPVGFSVSGNRGFYRPEGEVTLAEAIDLLVGGVEYASSLGLTELVLNGTGLTGYQQPTMMDRYQFGSSMANHGAGALRVAVVLPPKVIDPRRFGTLVANNRGLETDVFATEADAIVWLDGRTS